MPRQAVRGDMTVRLAAVQDAPLGFVLALRAVNPADGPPRVIDA